MPNNRSDSSDQSNATPGKDFEMMVNNLIKDPTLKTGNRPIKTMKVLPTQQSAVPLGKYTDAQTPKGFCVEVSPNPEPEHSLVTRVLFAGDPMAYSLTMVVANYGLKAVTVKIWRL